MSVLTTVNVCSSDFVIADVVHVTELCSVVVVVVVVLVVAVVNVNLRI